jgi:glycosyltransferase 2 family protein
MRSFLKSAGRWLPGVIISLVAIFLIIKYVDLDRLVQAIRSANYWLLLAFLALTLVWLAVRGIVWRTLLREKASYRDTFLTINEGYLLNNFLPFRLGEVGRAFLLGRKASLDFMEVLPTIVIERGVDLAFSAVILLSAIPFVVGAESARDAAKILGIIVVLGLVVLYVLARKHEWAMGLFNRFAARRPRLQALGEKFLAPLFAGLAILTDGWLFLRFFLWMLLDWLIAIAQFYILLLAFFPQAQLVWALFALGAVAFGNAIPSLPGAVGTYEGAIVWALTLVTHDQSTALAVAIVGHLSSYLVTGILGIYGLTTEGETLMGVYRQLRRRQEVNP